MNPNPMGGMPNGMMGMMPNGGQMNPNMARPQPQGMPNQHGYQPMQQLLLKQFHSVDKSQLPPGWQQVFNPSERVKYISELISMIKIMNPTQETGQTIGLARRLEEQVFKESPTKELYHQQLQQRKRELQARRQQIAGNIQQNLQQNPQLIGPSQHMFPQQPQQAMQMPNGMPNHFGNFNAQGPRPNMATPQMMNPQFGGQVPGMPMNGHPAMGQPANAGQMQNQFSQHDMQQISMIAQKMFNNTPPDQLNQIRMNMTRTITPAHRAQIGQHTDLAQYYFRQQAVKYFLTQKQRAAAGQMPPNMGMQGFNPAMQNQNGPGQPGFNPGSNIDFLNKQEEAQQRAAHGELVVPPSNQNQRPGSARMQPGMQGFPNMGGQQFPGQSPMLGQNRQGNPLMGSGINGQGPSNTPLNAINQPFSQPGSSPQVPPTPVNQNGQPTPQMPTAQQIQQMNAELPNFPPQVAQAFAGKTLPMQWYIYQTLKQRQAKMQADQKNMGIQSQSQPQGQPQSQAQPQPQSQPNQPQQPQPQQLQDQMKPGQANQRGQAPPPMTAEQEKKLDEFPFPPGPLQRFSLNYPSDIRKWGQLKAWAATQRLMPQQVAAIKHLQNAHFATLNRGKGPQQGGPAPASAAASAGPAQQNTANMAMNQPMLSDAHCDVVRSKNPAMAQMSNDEIRKRWAMMQAKQRSEKNAQMAAANDNANKTPAQTAQTTVVHDKAKQGVQNQNQNPKQPVKKPSSDDVVEVPNPNLPKDQTASHPQIKKEKSAPTQPTAQSNTGSQLQQAQRQGPSTQMNAALSHDTLNKYRHWRAEVQARLPVAQQAHYTAHQRQSVDGVLMGSLNLISRSDQFLMMYYQYCNLDKTPDERETDIKSLITFSLLVRRQFDTSDPNHPKVQEHLTLEYLSLASMLTKLKTAFQTVGGLNKTRQGEQAGTTQPSTQPGQQQFKAPQAPMVPDPARKSSTKRPSKEQAPPAPTDEKAPNPFWNNAQGIPQYAAGASSFDKDLVLPAGKKRKGLNGTPVPSPPTSSPAINNKSPRPAPAERAFKCKQDGCQNSKATFSSKEELQKHLDTAHEEPMPENPLEYALSNMRKSWNLDDEGKSKNAGPSKGGVPMSRVATGANSNAPRTPQSMSTAGSNSKPATPAMQNGKLPPKQAQAPLTPPQDLWANCAITAQLLAEILPPPPIDSLASLTPDSKTSPDAVDKSHEKDTVSPKTPKASDHIQLDSIKVEDVANVDKTNSMDFDFDFGGGMGPWESGMYGTAEALDGGLEELFGGDIALNGASSWEDMMYSDVKPTATTMKDARKSAPSAKPTASGTKRPQQDDGDWAKAFEMAFD